MAFYLNEIIEIQSDSADKSDEALIPIQSQSPARGAPFSIDINMKLFAIPRVRIEKPPANLLLTQRLIFISNNFTDRKPMDDIFL